MTKLEMTCCGEGYQAAYVLAICRRLDGHPADPSAQSDSSHDRERAPVSGGVPSHTR